MILLGYNQSQPAQSSVHSAVCGQLLQGQAPGRGLLLVDAVCWRGGVHQNHGLSTISKMHLVIYISGYLIISFIKTPSNVLNQNTNDDNHFNFHLNVKHSETSVLFYENVFIYNLVEM